jgi:hypothetical protein
MSEGTPRKVFVVDRLGGETQYIEGVTSLSEARKLHNHLSWFLNVPVSTYDHPTWRHPDPPNNCTCADRVREATAQEPVSIGNERARP